VRIDGREGAGGAETTGLGLARGVGSALSMGLEVGTSRTFSLGSLFGPETDAFAINELTALSSSSKSSSFIFFPPLFPIYLNCHALF
jgi:hypothetical protein